MLNTIVLLPLLAVAPAPLYATTFAAAAQTPAVVAVEETVASQIAEGRTALENGQPMQAEEHFNRAHELSGGAFETQSWVLRAWMDQGRSNNTLDALDALAKGGRKGVEMDYLYGMAFERRAEQAMMNGTGDVSVQMNFGDAVRFLQTATTSDPVLYRDAFLPLATAAWYSQELDVARAAAEEAVARYPKHGEANLMLGRIALSQFQVAHTAAEAPAVDAWPADVLEQWTAARDAFANAMAQFGTPKRTDTRTQNQISQAAIQLGHTWVWKGGRDEAAKAYGTAIGWAPDRVDIGTVRQYLSDSESPNDLSLFLAAMEDGTKRFQKTFGKQEPRNAALLWWLGYARYWGGARGASEEAYLACLELEPSYTNSWVYVGLCRYDAKKFDGAVVAFRSSWDADPTTTIRELQSDLNANAAKLRFLIGREAQTNNLELAAFLAELVAESTVNIASDWNNVGLFLRDIGDTKARTRGKKSEEEAAAIPKLYERALSAYERALVLTPEDPQVINDTAVLLHYNLQRDFDRAEAMYIKSDELAGALLEQGKLKGEELDRITMAKRDAGNNLRALRRLMKERAQPVEAGTGGAKGQE